MRVSCVCVDLPSSFLPTHPPTHLLNPSNGTEEIDVSFP